MIRWGNGASRTEVRSAGKSACDWSWSFSSPPGWIPKASSLQSSAAVHLLFTTGKPCPPPLVHGDHVPGNRNLHRSAAAARRDGGSTRAPPFNPPVPSYSRGLGVIPTLSCRNTMQMEHQVGTSIRPRSPRVIEELRSPIAGRLFRAGEIAIAGEVVVTPSGPPHASPAGPCPSPDPSCAPLAVLP